MSLNRQEETDNEENCTGTSNWASLNTSPNSTICCENEENCKGTSNWTLNTSASTICCGGSPNSTICGGNDQDELKELKLKMAAMENEFAKILAIQNEQKKQMTQLEAKNRKLEEKLENILKKEQIKETIKTDEYKHKPELLLSLRRKGKKGLLWNGTTTRANISKDGGIHVNDNANEWVNIFAEKKLDISGDDCLKNNILEYFEVKLIQMSPFNWAFYSGVSNGIIIDEIWVGDNIPKLYSFAHGNDYCNLDGFKHSFEWPNGAIKTKWNGPGDVVGCGLLLSPEKKVEIFFTANGILMGRPNEINHSEDYLIPTLGIYGNVSLEINVGDNLWQKPFQYDVERCPGLLFQ